MMTMTEYTAERRLTNLRKARRIIELVLSFPTKDLTKEVVEIMEE